MVSSTFVGSSDHNSSGQLAELVVYITHQSRSVESLDPTVVKVLPFYYTPDGAIKFWYPGIYSSLCISFENQAPVNLLSSTGAWSSNELQRLNLQIGHQDSAPNNGSQGDTPFFQDVGVCWCYDTSAVNLTWHIEAETKWPPFRRWHSLKFVLKGQIDKIPALVQIMAWRIYASLGLDKLTALDHTDEFSGWYYPSIPYQRTHDMFI